MTIFSIHDADAILRQIGRLQRDIKAEEVILNDAIDHMKKQSATKSEPMVIELKAAEKSLLDWIKKNKRDFTSADKKSKDLTYGTIGVMDYPPVPAFLPGYHEEEVAKALLKAGFRDCVKVSYKWIKNGVKNLQISADRLARLGIKMTQKRDQPFYSINASKIEEEA